MTISEAEKIFAGKLEFSNPSHLEARDLLRLKEEYLELSKEHRLGPLPDSWWDRRDLEMEIEDLLFWLELGCPDDYMRQRHYLELSQEAR